MQQISDALRVYRRPDIVASYRSFVELTSCEKRILHRHVPFGCAVLDLGVGAGRTTPFLCERASRYVGVDLSPEMVAAARKRFPEREFSCGDAADLAGYAPNSFDRVVFSFNGLGCLTDDGRRRCLAEVRRVLRSGGIFIFSLHNPRSLFLRQRSLRSLITSLPSNAKRFAIRVTGSPFWLGSGRLFTEAQYYFAAEERRVVSELVGYRHLETVNEDFPHTPNPLVSRWYYYAFEKIVAS